MSNQEQNKDNSGVLFKNTSKSNDKQPDYTGSITVNGKDLRLAAWENESKDKKTKFLKISVSDPANFTKKSDSPSQTQNTSNNNSQNEDPPVYGDIFDTL